MFRVLIADDNYEDRELLKMEIDRALGDRESDLRFFEASSVKQALQLLTSHVFDLMTLDIEFDRLNEGLDALPGLFETYPTLNIIVISGKLNKSEVLEQLFRFTKDNVLKGKRWARHFDVLDKKDNKTDALGAAYSFSVTHKDSAEKIRELFLLAESYLEQDMIDKCVEVYQKIQNISPGEAESKENIRIFRNSLSAGYAKEYYTKGEVLVSSLLLGHFIENRLKHYTSRILGRSFPVLLDCLKELERKHSISQYEKGLFQHLLRLRNRTIHKPSAITEGDFDDATRHLKLLGMTE